MNGRMLTLAETRARIEAGAKLLIAGDETLLRQLPEGEWVAGTIPYFIGPEGGVTTREVLFVNELPAQVTRVRVCTYSADELPQLAADRFENGFSVILLPATSDAHLRFASDAIDFVGLFDQPVIGWVAGVHLDDLGAATPMTFAGGPEGSSTAATVLHAELPPSTRASVDIVNPFQQGEGATLTFETTGFQQETVFVDGVATDFADYLRSVGHDTRLPIVANYFGTPVNVSIQTVPEDDGPVDLYAPVFSGIQYKLASPVDDYVAEFTELLPDDGVQPAFACNCILNYLYSELEGKRTGEITGPVTFGEVAYQLLNQTLVYLCLHEVAEQPGEQAA